MAETFSHFNYISCAKGLVLLAEYVRAGLCHGREHICLNCDIDLSGYADWEGWKPIGGEEVPFAGTFDGCGHVITGLRVNRPSKDYQGLFGNVSGVVKNVRLRDCFVIGRDFTGCVAGCISGGTIRDASVIGEAYGCNMVGGIVGQSVNSVLESNKFQGHVSGGKYIGGISGNAWRSKIAHSLNMSSKVRGQNYVGGIAGSLFGETLEGCRSSGRIIGHSTVGGIAGRIEDGKVLDCTVTSSVKGRHMVGAAGGFACGNNLIENCVFACSVFDGTEYQVNLADQIITYESESQSTDFAD